MEAIKRYEDPATFCGTEQHPEGVFVLYADHESALSAQLALNARLVEALRGLVMAFSGHTLPEGSRAAWDAAIAACKDPSAREAEEWLEEQRREAVLEALNRLIEELKDMRREHRPEPADGESLNSGCYEGIGLALEVVYGYLPDAALAPEATKGGAKRNTLDSVTAEFLSWALATFPESTPQSCVEHLRREVVELIEDPTSPGELADCAFLVVDAAHRGRVDLAAAMRQKLEVLKARKWGAPDAMGVTEHLREPEPPAEGEVDWDEQERCDNCDNVFDRAGQCPFCGHRSGDPACLCALCDPTGERTKEAPHGS